MQAAQAPAQHFKRSPFEILGECFAIFGKRFRSLIVIALIVQIPLTAIEIITVNEEETLQQWQALQATLVAAQQTEPQQSESSQSGLTQAPPQTDAPPAPNLDNLSDLLPAPLPLMSNMAISAMLYTFLTAAIAYAVGMHYAASAVDTGRSIGRAWWRVITLIILGLMFAAVTLLLMLTSVVTVLVLLFSMLMPALTVAMLLGIVIMLAIMSLMVYWSVATQAAAIEGCKPVAAIRRSFNLVRRNWWRTSATWLLTLLAVFGLTLLITILLSVASLATLPDMPVRFAISVISGLLTAPIIAIAGALIYLDLRARKDDYNPTALSQDLGIIQPTPTYEPNYGR